ncbi:ribonuclease HII [Paenibacillus sp. CGMCC 1.16610]|uniref:Ribonuclease HII n=1 Tax=Paenibacillus anseongense TaxID=2682845 RepID=A0ABW9UC03_9BACL|nr:MULTISPECIES: ribonuclease HII [Paenibacillus]MBA2937858.1 ribonuclease HII [Paenibacillus sp. CGMCC 1.16610]MVQ36916.1 ribonuclease HII [Paenibacillus anseongense]
MLEHEKEVWEQGFSLVAGIDEVGRGCLFGDVVAAAVILPQGYVLDGVNDSKKLSEKKRDALYEQIMSEALAVGVGIVDVDQIEAINIKQAARLAMKQAVEQLSQVPDYLLVDAEKVDLEIPQTAIIHGDALSQSIAAASIIAKVTRDRMCADWDEQYPEYGLAVHKGYATKHHREMLLRYGPTALHRKLFIRKVMAQLEEKKAQPQSEQLELDFI